MIMMCPPPPKSKLPVWAALFCLGVVLSFITLTSFLKQTGIYIEWVRGDGSVVRYPAQAAESGVYVVVPDSTSSSARTAVYGYKQAIPLAPK